MSGREVLVLMSSVDSYFSMPKERVGALIGKSGQTKKKFEELTKTSIKINSETGEVVVQSSSTNTELLPVAKNILRAIACGFSGESALTLTDEDKHLEVIDLKETVGKSYKEIERIKGHIIGRDGKVRKNLEAYTGSRISVYASSIAIICDIEDLGATKRAVELLIKGATCNGVYRFLEGYRRKKKENLSLWGE